MRDPRPECKDCVTEGVTTHRPARKPGPRCETHWRAFRTGQKTRSQDARRARTYALTPADHAELLAAQGGLCAVCGPYTGNRGARRALTHDHDHKCCAGKISCGRCVRGLICGTCNTFLGRIGDHPEVGLLLHAYLTSPPWQAILRQRELGR